MSARLGRRLRRERRRLADALAGKLEADPNADVDAELARIDRVDALLGVLPADGVRGRLARLAVLVVSVFVVAAAWTIRVDAFGIATPLVATVETEALAFDLAGDATAAWRLREPIVLAGHADLLLAAPSVRLSDPALAGAAPATAATLAVRAAGLELTELRLSPGASLRLSRSGAGRLDVALAAGALRGTAQFGGAGSIGWRGARAEGARPFDLLVPEVARFEATVAGGAEAARLSLPLVEAVVLHDLAVSRISFVGPARAAPAAEDVFASASLAGSIRLPDVDATTELRFGERLSLPGLDGTIRRIAVPADGPLAVTLTGVADRILVHGEGYARDLTPSLLVFILRHEPWAFFLGAVTSLWGIIWGLRRWI